MIKLVVAIPLFFFCRNKNTPSVRTRGTLLLAKVICHNKHIHKWQSQPIVNNTGAGNIRLSGAILFTGNTFNRISEMFGSINISPFSRTLFYNIQKTLLFPTTNSVYMQHQNKIKIEKRRE